MAAIIKEKKITDEIGEKLTKAINDFCEMFTAGSED